MNAVEALDDTGWSTSAELIAEDPRLRLDAPSDERRLRKKPARPGSFAFTLFPMKPAKEVEFEVLGKESATNLSKDDPWVALIAKLMDTAFVIPGTRIRFGLDPLIGLLPGLGDTASAMISGALIFQSARHGLPKVVLARMALNVLVNASVGAIPVLGDFFSVWFRSNALNYALLQKHAGTGRPSTRPDWIFVGALLAVLIAGLGLLFFGAAMLVGAMFRGHR